MDDNARPHRTLAVEELLESEDITQMDWPAYSPDLNPIKHVGDALGRCIAARLHHPENTQELKQMLIEEWVLLPQEMLHQLVLSMRRRCIATIAEWGSNPRPHQWTRTPKALHQSKYILESGALDRSAILTVSVALFTYTRTFGNGPRHFELWSSDEDDT
ncbi:transposable element Tcb2 transposase [Trichonephila clavipes]|nr:transposable element Tcb2 transposase [Trichonephila clavipes]